MTEFECIALVDTQQFQYATSLFLDEKSRNEERTVLSLSGGCLIIDAPLGLTAVPAEGVWPKLIGIRSKLLHSICCKVTGTSQLRLAYDGKMLHVAKTLISAVEVEMTADGMFEFNRAEIDAAFKQSLEIHPSIKDDLTYDDMLTLADLFGGWAQSKALPPLQCASYAGKADAFQRLADEVGPEWSPDQPGPLSLLPFMAKHARGEIPRKRKRQ